MSDEDKIISAHGFSSKALLDGLQQGDIIQKGFSSANLQTALKVPVESSNQGGSGGRERPTEAPKK